MENVFSGVNNTLNRVLTNTSARATLPPLKVQEEQTRFVRLNRLRNRLTEVLGLIAVGLIRCQDFYFPVSYGMLLSSVLFAMGTSNANPPRPELPGSAYRRSANWT